MKATILTCETPEQGFKPVGTIQTMGGKAVASAGAQSFLLDYITDPKTGRDVTPKDGDAYVAALPAQFSHSGRISAELEQGGD